MEAVVSEMGWSQELVVGAQYYNKFQLTGSRLGQEQYYVYGGKERSM